MRRRRSSRRASARPANTSAQSSKRERESQVRAAGRPALGGRAAVAERQVPRLVVGEVPLDDGPGLHRARIGRAAQDVEHRRDRLGVADRRAVRAGEVRLQQHAPAA